MDVLFICGFSSVDHDGVPMFGGDGGNKDNRLGKWAARFNMVIRTARSQNPHIRIIAMQMFGGDSDFASLNNPKKREMYADSVRDFLAEWHDKKDQSDKGAEISLRVDGYDVDYELGNRQEYTPDILLMIRERLNGLSKNTHTKFYVSITPADTEYLSGSKLAQAVDYVNMQNYDGGQSTSPDDYLRQIPDLKPSQLIWGATVESPPVNTFSVTSMDDAIVAMQKEYPTSNQNPNHNPVQKGPLAGIFLWRLNSDNAWFENMVHVALYSKVQNKKLPDGLDDLVRQGWNFGGRDGGGNKGKDLSEIRNSDNPKDLGHPIHPYLEEDWNNANWYSS
ncbi:MAG: hypothetical protein Q9167_002972 [Letrouitia subvulpina]